MKKTISVLLSLVFFCSLFSISFSAYAEESEMKKIEFFADEIVAVVNDYDEGKVFELVDESTPEEDDLQFQTARLFVKCSSYFNKMGAEEKVSGFSAWHLLQFSSPEEAKKAYNYYLNQKYIECVEPDAPMKAELNASGNDIQYVTKEEFLNDYSRQVMGFDQVLPYIKNNNIQTAELKVAVLDTGVDYNHEIFEGRLFRTYFNATDIGAENDEYDIEVAEGHGTAVCGNIVVNTPDTVKIGCYKALDNNKHNDQPELVPSRVVAALLQAYSDGCVAVNMSFVAPVSLTVFRETLEELYNNGIALFAGAGNENAHATYGRYFYSLCTQNTVCAVGGSDKTNNPARFTNSGYWVKFLAPAQEVKVACPDNKYRVWNGTSLSTPLALAEYIVLRSLNNDYSNEKIIDLMAYSCQPIRDNTSSYNDVNSTWHGNAWYGSGILDVSEAFCEMQKINRPSKVSFSLTSGENYHVGDKLTLTAEDGAKIYYTLNGEYPTTENRIEYTAPISLDHLTEIHTYAVNEGFFHGQSNYGLFRGFDIIPESEFVINENGTITDVPVNYEYLEIPDYVNGIKVKSIMDDVFYKYYSTLTPSPIMDSFNIKALKLPDSVEFIEDHGEPDEESLLFCNPTIEYFCAKGLKTIGYKMFSECSNLYEIDTPNVELICHNAFYHIDISILSLPKATYAEAGAFKEAFFKQIFMPHLVSFEGPLFETVNTEILQLDSLEQGYISEDWEIGRLMQKNMEFLSILSLPKMTIVEDGDFRQVLLGRVEFSNVKSLKSLPTQTYTDSSTRECIILVPTTLKNIDLSGDISKNAEKRNMLIRKFYGTKGCYAEQWANENNIEFVELNQDTAVITDIRENCNEYTRTLFFDSLGFNKEYQWYGSYDNSTDNGIELVGATNELLNLKDFQEYPYYYCVCTSTDIDEEENFEHQELIYSRVCTNIDYAEADYTEYNSAVEQANSLDRSLYKNLTALDESLSKDVSGLPSSMQSMVDEATQAILNAINALEYKDADYSAYNAAVEKANALDRSLYKDLTALDEALAVDVSGKNVTEQDIIDSQTQAILDAIDALELKPMEYKIIEGANGEYEQGSKKDLIIVSDAEFDKFESVEIDGKTIDINDYIAEAGSTRITLKSSYLDNLSLGEHSISIISSDGRASTTFTVKQVSESTTESTTESQSEPESTTKKSPETTAENVTESSNQNEKTTDNHYVPDDEKSPRTGNGKIGSTVCCFTLLLSSACLLYVLKRKE